MQTSNFRSIITAFADPGSELLYEGSKLLLSVNGEVFDVNITTVNGDVFVDEGTGPKPASAWVLGRLARLSMLAARLKETIATTPFFVTPAANLLPSLELQPDEKLLHTADALSTTLEAISSRSPLESTVLYITSDAGEGKTSLINQMARVQADRFLSHESDWLLVPIPLGGKHFLRFDDITVGALQNRYRFPFLYYDSFLALVRMGVIVPAFDGFEEMLVESSSGEALSAMGQLLSALDSTGAMIVAARKAYFEFENLKIQEKLFDSISSYSVGFSKLELSRWEWPQFAEYCQLRSITNSRQIFERVSERLTASHPLLTRPVLVRRLIDLAQQSNSLDDFLSQIQKSGTDYLSVFVRGIIEREAHEKWIDRSGKNEVGAPLLSVDEHIELLADIALAAWEGRVDYLKRDVLEFVTDYFSEAKRKSAFQAQQIRERIRGHALLIPSPNATQAVEFDHEEFRSFFLGEGLATQLRPLNDRAKGEVLSTLRRGVLPRDAQRAFWHAMKRDRKIERLQAAKFLLSIASLDGQASYTQENCSGLVLRLLSDVDGNSVGIEGLAFGADAMRDRKLRNVEFRRCYFASTSLELVRLENCAFSHCKFGQLRIYSTTLLSGVTFQSCEVESMRLADREIELWEPSAIEQQLAQLGIRFLEQKSQSESQPIESSIDPAILQLEKLLRYFMRSTHMSESVMLVKLGNRAQGFLEQVLPKLVENGVFAEIENRGSGIQRRFKLGTPLEDLHRAMAEAQGSFSGFLRELNRGK